MNHYLRKKNRSGGTGAIIRTSPSPKRYMQLVFGLGIHNLTKLLYKDKFYTSSIVFQLSFSKKFLQFVVAIFFVMTFIFSPADSSLFGRRQAVDR